MSFQGSSLYFFIFRGKMNTSYIEKKSKSTIFKTKKRIHAILLAFFLFLSLLLSNLIKLQIPLHSYYKDKVYNQITTTANKRADRGNIYDANMTLLATTNTSWRIFISTRDIKNAEREVGVDYGTRIATGLSKILNIDKAKILNKIRNTNVLDVTIKKSASEAEYNKILNFIKQNSLDGLILTEAQSTRYYPKSTLASHTLGFVGSDSQGLYGLEYYYDEYLSGKDGYYLYSKDANGNTLSTEYATYIPAEAGLDLVTTLDTYVQEALESQIEQIVKNHNVTNRVTGIVMNANTGAILAMATSSPFNPNSPYTLDSLSQEKLGLSGYKEDTDEYKKLKKELLEVMWSNKAVSETYEPGSTFKIVTVSTALNLGLTSMNDKFSCHGYHTVGGWRIKCHKVTGHGSSFPLSYGLQMSCNPTMMVLAEKIGANNFYDYVESFGYFEKSGIDLPSEASTIFHEKENIGSTELATASFGQRFKVSIINHLTALAVVANGGNLITPYLVDKMINSDGKIVYEHEVEIKRRVISDDVATIVSEVLEGGVSGEGGAKNARVDGYKIAAKTGTSQKFDILDENGNSYLRIGSTVAYNISEDNSIISIIVVDEPTTSVKYGSVVAAPYISALFSTILPYLDYKSTNEIEKINVPSLIGLSVNSAKKILCEKKLEYEIIGDGSLVLSQSPTGEDIITNSKTKIYLYTTKEDDLIIVPSLVGKDISEATEICINLGLNIEISGSKNGGVITYQSLPVGSRIKKGSIIKLKALILDFED